MENENNSKIQELEEKLDAWLSKRHHRPTEARKGKKRKKAKKDDRDEVCRCSV